MSRYLEYVVHESKGRLFKRILMERIDFDMTGMKFPHNHELYEVFNTKIQELVSAGLVDHYEEEFSKYLNPKLYKHLNLDGPKVLTMKHLEAGFVIWMIPLFFAMITFCCEWFVRLKEYLLFNFILLSLYKLKRS
jgi:hypothetical protein